MSAIPSVDPKNKRERIILSGDVPSPIKFYQKAAASAQDASKKLKAVK